MKILLISDTHGKLDIIKVDLASSRRKLEGC